MPFFARPNLDNTQFKQLKGGEPLTLSGQTQIATVTGLTLATGTTNSDGVIITASGASSATNNHVLTYNHALQKIVLRESSANGGTGVYPYDQSATTTVGGLEADTNLFEVPIVDILQQILVPTLEPDLIPPSITSFSINPSTTLYEIGSSVDIELTTNFSRGSINPQYSSASQYRSGLPNTYNYIVAGSATDPPISGTNTSDVFDAAPFTIGVGSNNLSVSVSYDAGVQPKDSAGGDFDSPLPSGTTSPSLKTLTGIYPYFWGKSSTAPTAGQALIESGTKVVNPSTGSVAIDFQANNEYLWLAIPIASQIKTKWTGSNSSTNTESIPGGLFPAPTTETVDSPTALWTGIDYRFYISNYKTETFDTGGSPFIITFSNS